MKDEYDLDAMKSRPNPYAERLGKQVPVCRPEDRSEGLEDEVLEEDVRQALTELDKAVGDRGRAGCLEEA